MSGFTLIDGGLSTAIEDLGGDVSGHLWTAGLAVTDPDLLERAHRSFVEAGAEVIATASYQCDARAFEASGLAPSDARRVLASMTTIARRAASGSTALVAASVGPFGASLADGSEYTGRYGVEWSVVERYHREKLEVLVDSGADLVAVETIPLVDEARLIADVLTELGAPRAWFSFGCATESSTYGGDDLTRAVAAVADYPSLVAVGINCVAPTVVAGALANIECAAPGRELIAYPNHGRAWDATARAWTGDESAFTLDGSVDEWVTAGARYIGGCCGVGPTGIARLAARRKDS
ncbi:MAG: homocysteine S-methyltransferase [Actinomycetota bacterium]